MTTEYRSDIDGLRAIAVLSVVFYHFFPEWVPGGYVGVDVFFVISGFLITGIIHKNLLHGRFTFQDFYSRRIRRIFPALAVVLGFCLWYGWYSLLPEEYVSLNRYIAASGAFITNFVLWEKTVAHGGYFNIAAELNPMLHLWSLSIEEQFYLIWPPLCLWLYKTRSRFLFGALSLALVSFVLNVIFIGQYPTATFYLPFTRLWELLIGGVLAITSFSFVGPKKEGLSAFGLLLLLIGVFALNSKSPFPGWAALLPVIGTVLIIAAGPNAWINRKALSVKAIVYIGLISYPLYLWHWPLFSFSRIENFEPLTSSYRFGLLILSFALAWATYQFLEKPIRHARSDFRYLVTMSTLIVLASVCITAKIFMKINYPTRLSKISLTNYDISSLSLGKNFEQHTNSNCLLKPDDVHLTTSCHSDKREGPVSLVYGDSRAAAIFPGLVETSTSGQRWAVISRRGCAPLSGFQRTKVNKEFIKDAKDCDALNSAALLAIEKDPNIKVVLFALAARVIDETLEMTGGDQRTKFMNSLKDAITRIQASGKKVVWLEDNPYFMDPKYCVKDLLNNKDIAVSSCGISKQLHEAQYKNYNELVSQLRSEISQMQVFETTPLLCDDTFCPMIRDGKFLYSDRDHYSDFGSRAVAGDIVSKIYDLSIR